MIEAIREIMMKKRAKLQCSIIAAIYCISCSLLSIQSAYEAIYLGIAFASLSVGLMFIIAAIK